ncbi:hypothetical protein SCOCK_360068 [Actinacidiphila cocklensis]|uniref:Uncharacterized protein n=1 Tax=Actinacidiphila cocklensis TaxID=887465 RepID=A0A9W4GSU8_9ACTN|nr:hypothetical protein SCOCK_360068 [Actinacidiphila cocklensis]
MLHTRRRPGNTYERWDGANVTASDVTLVT